ncbi:PREDICTED: transmembrane protein 26-like [Branchiostoma belcheri]|uniref:Transmembrane protein 26-like n=1 Tax=Branchiostoma belcheri TaxID=7741 RepID=A0A6P4YU36_BRABE|nr:PREDICTED: transmembrane protein 26-like [Branchiostoma belcheri]
MAKKSTCISQFCTVLKCLVTRILFVAHGLVCIWRATVGFPGNNMLWFLMVPVVLLFVETMVTLVYNKGKEWGWFCPSVFLYLFCTVPSIWFMEFSEQDRRLASIASARQACLNATANSTLDDDEVVVSLQSIGLDLTLTIDSGTWVLGLEQALVFLLILGRWLLPTNLKDDQLSQLLLSYIGMAADILELLEVFEEPKVLRNQVLTFVVLMIFSLSLLQFTVVFTAIPDRMPTCSVTCPPGKDCRGLHCCNPEIFNIYTTIILQDGAFFAIRVYLFFVERVFSQGLLFFAGKNMLVILLDIYRIKALFSRDDEDEEKEENELQDRATTEAVTVGGVDNQGYNKDPA